jgi:hypothetical protein
MEYMDDVTYEQRGENPARPQVRAHFDLAGYLVKVGAAPDKNIANYILLGVSVGAICIAAALWHKSPPSPTVPPEGAPTELYHP